MRLDPARETDGAPWKGRARSGAATWPSLATDEADNFFFARGLQHRRATTPQPVDEPSDNGAVTDDALAPVLPEASATTAETDCAEAPSPSPPPAWTRPGWWRSLQRLLRRLGLGRTRTSGATTDPLPLDAAADGLTRASPTKDGD
jgi:hypothetical protein